MSTYRRNLEQKITDIVRPLDSCLELRETKMNLDAEHDGPVHLATFPLFRLSTAGQRR